MTPAAPSPPRTAGARCNRPGQVRAEAAAYHLSAAVATPERHRRRLPPTVGDIPDSRRRWKHHTDQALASVRPSSCRRRRRCRSSLPVEVSLALLTTSTPELKVRARRPAAGGQSEPLAPGQAKYRLFLPWLLF